MARALLVMALLVMDMQNGIDERIDDGALLARVGAAVAAARGAGMPGCRGAGVPVIFVRVAFRVRPAPARVSARGRGLPGRSPRRAGRRG